MDITIDRFLRYDSLNPQIWDVFEELALKMIKEDRQYFGASAIMERVRWYTRISAYGVFKVNNNWTPFYVRKFALKYPEYAQFFRKRGSTADQLTHGHFNNLWCPAIADVQLVLPFK